MQEWRLRLSRLLGLRPGDADAAAAPSAAPAPAPGSGSNFGRSPALASAYAYAFASKRPRDSREDDPPAMKRYCNVSNSFPKIMPTEDDSWIAPKNVSSSSKVRHIPITIEDNYSSSSFMNSQLHPSKHSSPIISCKASASSRDESRWKHSENGHNDSASCTCNTKCSLHEDTIERYSRPSDKMSNSKLYHTESAFGGRKPVRYYVDDDEDDDVECLGVVHPQNNKIIKDDDVIELHDAENYDLVLVKRAKSPNTTILDTSKKKFDSPQSSNPKYYIDLTKQPNKFFKSKDSRLSGLSSHSIKDRTFKSPSSIIKPRATLFNSFRTSCSNRTKNFRTAIAKSFRLDEKKDFQELISRTKLSTLPRSSFAKQFQRNFIKQNNELDNAKTSTIDLIANLYTDKLANGNVNKSNLKENTTSNINANQEQSDTEVVTSADESSTTSSVQLKRQNSLEVRLRHRKVVSPIWLDNLTKKYNEISLHREKEVTKIEEVILDELPALTDEHESKIDSALRSHPNQALVEKFNQTIRGRDIASLNGLNWLNDEVINFYMNLIMERSQNKKNDLPKVYSMNTFFYPRLMESGHSALKRWTRKVDIFSNDMMLVPVHLDVHWCMSIVNFKDKTIKYYDSMGGKNKECCSALLQYLVDERMDKLKEKFDTSGWQLECVKEIPHQMNGSDCGMFSCMFAEYASRNVPITFSQNDMPYFRRKMVLEIIQGQLIT
ncbi:uncharacterized protein LOC143917836 [Arctopsyche grandis]|uniref:uncharacterized protein LOC143917836 n=1 Tax=Arctopsyche grandis TaxID=121162 RepID=UPI00406D8D6E